MRNEVVSPSLRLGFAEHWFAVAVAVPFLVLGVGHLLPATGVGEPVRLAGAAAIVLLVPGALLQRVLGWPLEIGVALAGSLVWSLVLLFAAMAVTFAVGASFTLALVLLTGAALGAAFLGWRRAGPGVERKDAYAALAAAAATLPFLPLIWLVNRTAIRDSLFHIAYARKLDELPRLDSLDVVGHFSDGGLHPGYAFPLWHGVLAAVARLSGVDVENVVLHLGPVLTPLALVIGYGMGMALFRSLWGGLATAVLFGGISAFEDAYFGLFASLSDPASAARGLLVPALLALTFVYVRGERRGLLSVVAAGFVLAVVHPNYAPYVAVVLAGCVAARFLVMHRESRDWLRIAAAVGAILVPSLLFIAWLWPVLSDTTPFTPDADTVRRDWASYEGFFVGSQDSFRLSTEVLTRHGGITIAGFLAIPLAALAARRIWSAFVLGTAIVVLAVVLTPPLFTLLSDLASISQARRLPIFLPLAVALAGAAVLAGRFRWLAVGGALGAGILLSVVYTGETTQALGEGGPAWPVWVAVVGAVAGLAYAVWRRPLGPEPGPWAVAAAVAFLLPFAVSTVAGLEREPTDSFRLSDGLVEALRSEASTGDVVMAKPETQYRVVASAPVYVVAVPKMHTIDTATARPFERLRDTARFFDPGVTPAERNGILERYGASWLVLDKRRGYPEDFREYVRSLEAVYRDDRYVLFRVEPS